MSTDCHRHRTPCIYVASTFVGCCIHHFCSNIWGGFYRESQPTHPRTTPSSPGTGAETCKREKPNRRKKEAVVQSLAGPPNSFESERKHFYWSAGKRRGDTRDVTPMTSHTGEKFRILFFQEMRIESEIFRAYHFRRHDLGFQ